MKRPPASRLRRCCDGVAMSAICSKAPTSFAMFNDKVYFAASDGVNGTELWTSDGTGAGTAMAVDIDIGPAGSSPASLTVVGTNLFFAATDVTNGRELWRCRMEPDAQFAIKRSNTAPGVVEAETDQDVSKVALEVLIAQEQLLISNEPVRSVAGRSKQSINCGRRCELPPCGSGSLVARQLR